MGEHGLATTRQAVTEPLAVLREAGLVADGIPLHSSGVEDVQAEHERLTALGVRTVLSAQWWDRAGWGRLG
ncbi:hypothetical protein ACH9DO_05835 [Kocuria sp. M1N1S27]|uniref:hypothetical protein n=1 Tax=Kocuria kalidii TaxID=3376283 RepID=UPI00379E6156